MPGIKSITLVAVRCSCGTDLTDVSTVEYTPSGKATLIVPMKCQKCSSIIFNDGKKRGFDEGVLEGLSSEK